MAAKSSDKAKLYKYAQEDTKMAVALAKKEAKEVMTKAKAKLKEAELAVDKKIQTHPEQAVLIAGAIGAAVGAIAAYGIMHSKAKKK